MRIDEARRPNVLRSGRRSWRAARLACRFHGRRLVRKVRLVRLPIRVVFLAQDPLDWWSAHSLYVACRDDPRFEVAVVSIGFGPWQGISTDCGELFGRLGIDAVDGIASPDALLGLRPDILVVTSPYDQYRPTAYGSSELALTARIVYIPYGVDFGDATGRMSDVFFGQPLLRRAWRIVASSPARAAWWARRLGAPRTTVIGLGLPVLDQTHAADEHPPLPGAVSNAAAGRFTILYTPHHTLEDWSTFLEHGPTMKRLLDEHDDWYLLFRPHPSLGPALELAGVMPRDEFVRYFSGERSHLDESAEFFPTLVSADVIVTDASSMLFHFAPTDRPIVYLERVGGPGLDDLASAYVERACYVVRTADDLEATLHRLAHRVDPLADARCDANHSGIPVVTADGAGGRVAAHLAAELGGRRA